MRSLIVVFFAFILLFSCSSKEEDTNYYLHHAGSRLNMMQNQDFSAKIDLDTLQNLPGLMALGPIEHLKGEVTIFDGRIYTATMQSDSVVFRRDSAVKAIFLAYGTAENYQTVEIDDPLNGLKDIEKFIHEKSEEHNLDLEKSFPFYIEANVHEMEYHIMFKEGEEMHGHDQHKKAKRKFMLNNSKLKIVGVKANSNEEGIYTHKGSRTHLHFVNEQTLASGHVDDVQIKKGSKLFLPKNE